jgi:hypothetical protein
MRSNPCFFIEVANRREVIPPQLRGTKGGRVEPSFRFDHPHTASFAPMQLLNLL